MYYYKAISCSALHTTVWIIRPVRFPFFDIQFIRFTFKIFRVLVRVIQILFKIINTLTLCTTRATNPNTTHSTDSARTNVLHMHKWSTYKWLICSNSRKHPFLIFHRKKENKNSDGMSRRYCGCVRSGGGELMIVDGIWWWRRCFFYMGEFFLILS